MNTASGAVSPLGTSLQVTELSSWVLALIPYKYEGPPPPPRLRTALMGGVENYWAGAFVTCPVGHACFRTDTAHNALAGRSCKTWNLDLNETSPCKVHVLDN